MFKNYFSTLLAFLLPQGAENYGLFLSRSLFSGIIFMHRITIATVKSWRNYLALIFIFFVSLALTLIPFAAVLFLPLIFIVGKWLYSTQSMPFYKTLPEAYFTHLKETLQHDPATLKGALQVTQQQYAKKSEALAHAITLMHKQRSKKEQQESRQKEILPKGAPAANEEEFEIEVAQGSTTASALFATRAQMGVLLVLVVLFFGAMYATTQNFILSSATQSNTDIAFDKNFPLLFIPIFLFSLFSSFTLFFCFFATFALQHTADWLTAKPLARGTAFLLFCMKYTVFHLFKILGSIFYLGLLVFFFIFIFGLLLLLAYYLLASFLPIGGATAPVFLAFSSLFLALLAAAPAFLHFINLESLKVLHFIQLKESPTVL